MVPVSKDVFVARLPELVDIYIRAMRYNPVITTGRIASWRDQVELPGWSACLAIAHPPDEPAREALSKRHRQILGVTYGYTGHPGHWWYDQVQDACPEPLPHFFEIAEVHCAPQAQGFGIGKALVEKLCENRTEKAALLSTPEVADEANRAWHLYRSLGFQDVLRDFHFRGDSRPFAVLGRPLPLQ